MDEIYCSFCQISYMTLADMVYHINTDHFMPQRIFPEDSSPCMMETIRVSLEMEKPLWFTLVRKLVVPKIQNLIVEKLNMHPRYTLNFFICVTYTDAEMDSINDFNYQTKISKLMSKTTIKAVILEAMAEIYSMYQTCLLYTSPSPRDKRQSRMPSSA